MRSFKVIFIGVALGIVALPARAACERNESGAFEDAACAAAAFAEADKHLNETYQKLLSQLDEEAKHKLVAAQRAWLAYRNANSEFVYAVEGDGSLGRVMLTNNAEQQTIARTKELSGWLPR